MAKPMKLSYTEKHHILEVDGVGYEIPQRTAAIMQKIKERDEDMPNHTEYENNMALLEILFGEEKAKQMFPDGEDTNLDKLYKCTKYALALFNADFNKIQNEMLNKVTSELKQLLEELTQSTQNMKLLSKQVR